MKPKMHFLSCLAHFFVEWEMFQANVVENIQTQFISSYVFSKIVPLMRKC
jgi:hypothetical protein